MTSIESKSTIAWNKPQNIESKSKSMITKLHGSPKHSKSKRLLSPLTLNTLNIQGQHGILLLQIFLA
jgi:hypothetical protein